jgi:hypothetical protein
MCTAFGMIIKYKLLAKGTGEKNVAFRNSSPKRAGFNRTGQQNGAAKT